MRFPCFSLLCLTALLLTGCAGYQLGSTNGAVAGARSIEVFPFNNQTLEPRLGDAVTQSLRERLQTDGTFRLVTRGGGDVVVTGVIKRYYRIGLSYLNVDVSTTENYRIGITAHVVARSSSSGKVLLEKDISGFTLVNVGTDLASTERQSLSLLADDLARNVTMALAEGSW
jgi:hypothetical protein